jgi:hypothetical protein
VGAAWGQGASKTQLCDLQSDALPLRHGPMSYPRRKARDTVGPTSVECAWAWGAKAAGHHIDPCVHASIHPRPFPPVQDAMASAHLFRCPAPGILAATAPVV